MVKKTTEKLTLKLTEGTPRNVTFFLTDPAFLLVILPNLIGKIGTIIWKSVVLRLENGVL